MKEYEAVYVSGPITNSDPEIMRTNLLRGSEVGARLYEQGKLPFIPHANSEKLRDYTHMEWRDYMRIDIELLKRSDSIYMMNGWQNSRGARIEHFLALRWGKKPYYEEESYG